MFSSRSPFPPREKSSHLHNIVMIKEEKIISEYGKLKGGYRHNLGSLYLTERVVILGLKIYLLIGKNLKVKLI